MDRYFHDHTKSEQVEECQELKCYIPGNVGRMHFIPPLSFQELEEKSPILLTLLELQKQKEVKPHTVSADGMTHSEARGKVSKRSKLEGFPAKTDLRFLKHQMKIAFNMPKPIVPNFPKKKRVINLV